MSWGHYNEQMYGEYFPHGDKLDEIKRLINWERFRPMLEPLFRNAEVGRPHEDVALMVKMLVLQSWHGLSDEQLELQCNDRLTFQNFLGYPEKVPDARTIWLFKERVAQAGKDRELWDELNRQLSGKFVVKRGEAKDVVFVELGGLRREGEGGKVVEVSRENVHMQDSTMLESDPGAPTEEDLMKLKERKGKGADVGKAMTLTDEELRRTKERGDGAKTRRSKDGTWTKKRGRSYFGFKLHTKLAGGTGLIEGFAVTTASVHDGRVDLSDEGEVVIRDKGFDGSPARGYAINMIRAYVNRPLTEEDREFNRFMSKLRAPVEHPYAFMRRAFNFTRICVTTVARVRMRALFLCASYNLLRAAFLTRRIA